MNPGTSNDPIRREEEQRLQRTVKEIRSQLREAKEISAGRRDEVIATRTDMWQHAPKVIHSFEDAVVFHQHRQVLDQQEREYMIYRRLIPQLKRLYESAYFGRIDFQPRDESNGTAIQIYIGTTSLVERQSGHHLIYDWRAPISSLFYDYEPGPSRFQTAHGTVEGTLLLKRQFKIEGDNLVYLFDTDVKIDDDLLQSILGQTATPHMRTIVQTIQREQNEAIRDEDHDLLVVLGPAGSGKTSIALHRIAYILYRDRDRVDAESIIIVSPNDIFGDYISRVLPDLGEEDVPHVTFDELALKEMKRFSDRVSVHVEPFHKQMEYLLSGEEDEQRKSEIRLKESDGLYEAIHAFAGDLMTGVGLPLTDVLWRDRLIISKTQIKTLLNETYAYLPFRNRLEKTARRISYLMDPLVKARADRLKQRLADDPDEPHLSSGELNARVRATMARETADVRRAIRQMTEFDTLQWYASFWSDPGFIWSHLSRHEREIFSQDEVALICHRSVGRLRSGRLAAEDIPPFLAFKALLGDMPSNNDVKHVVIDEAQDYSPFHFQVLRRKFPRATLTLVGDPDQSIHPIRPTLDWKKVASVLQAEKAKTVQLLTSYRQTEEIARFARGILPRDDVRLIDRPGEKPRIIFTDGATRRERAHIAFEEISRWHREGFDMVAVVGKTAAESQQAYAALQSAYASFTRTETEEAMKPHLLTAEDNTLYKGVLVMPAYLAKGLEFDAVLIFDAGREAYTDESERKLFYTACTRALHRLTLMIDGEPTDLLSGVHPHLYSRHTM